MRKAKFLLGGFIIALVSAGLSFLAWGLWGLLIWGGLFAFVLVEVLYHFGTQGSLLHGFRSTASGEIPDAGIAARISSPRGWYDLDNRGRGKN